MKTFIIAEAGANHDRNFKQALALIDVAVEAGASACKFQTYSSETLYSKFTPDFAGFSNIRKLIKDIELPRKWQKDLKQYCDEKNIEFMSTPFDEAAVEELVEIGVKRLKISGFEATDPRFVHMVCSAKLPIIVSLGIGSDFSLISRILNIASSYDIEDVTFLHCNNAYPTPLQDVNLGSIMSLAAFNPKYKVGFSDHTRSILTPALAVASGAQVIEKHFTLSRRLDGPDHAFALEPDELKMMVEYVKVAEECIGHKLDKISESELSYKNAMRSIVTKRNIKKGEVYTNDNITTKRPFLENAVPASYFYSMIGSVALRDFKEDEHIMRTDTNLYII